MHRTLKRQAVRPVKKTCAAQQRVFDSFRAEYNDVRPHEWLNQETPASHYTESPRPYPSRLPILEYPGHFVVKKITTGGTFRFHYKLLYIANSLVNQHIGLEETDDGVWSIYFNAVLIATLNERDYIIRGYTKSVTHVAGLICYLSPRLLTRNSIPLHVKRSPDDSLVQNGRLIDSVSTRSMTTRSARAPTRRVVFPRIPPRPSTRIASGMRGCFCARGIGRFSRAAKVLSIALNRGANASRSVHNLSGAAARVNSLKRMPRLLLTPISPTRAVPRVIARVR
jgi:hypothetical protein